jgi:hypothetical protein
MEWAGRSKHLYLFYPTGTLSVVVTARRKVAKGGELFTSYLDQDADQSTEERRAMLKATLRLRLLLGEPAAALQVYLERIEGSPDAQDPGVAVLTAWLFDQIGRRDLSLQAVESARRGGPRNMSLVLIDALTLRDDPAAAAARWSGQVQLEGRGDVMSRCLLNGYDDISRTQEYRPAIEAFESRHRASHPWMFR